jgi:hypothetical protein
MRPALHAWQTEKGTRAQAVARGKLIEQRIHNVPDFDQTQLSIQKFVTLITRQTLFADLEIPKAEKRWLLWHFRETRRDFTPNPMLPNAYSQLVIAKIDKTLETCRVAELCMKCLKRDLLKELASNRNNLLTLERISDDATAHIRYLAGEPEPMSQ